jgi:hypothetical protein
MTLPKNIEDAIGGAVEPHILIEETRATVAETNRVIQETRERIARTRAHNQELAKLAHALDEANKPDDATTRE